MKRLLERDVAEWRVRVTAEASARWGEEETLGMEVPLRSLRGVSNVGLHPKPLAMRRGNTVVVMLNASEGRVGRFLAYMDAWELNEALVLMGRDVSAVIGTDRLLIGEQKLGGRSGVAAAYDEHADARRAENLKMRC